jgi:hypothetical protein
MNSNVGIQNVGSVAWDGLVTRGYDIRKFVRFGWSFEVIGAIAADAIFNVEAAPPSDADPCVAGVYAAVPEVSICDRPAVPDAQAQVTIPAGTPIGTICAGTIPCRPNAFVRVNPLSGTTANVRVVLVRQGPMI